MTTITSSPLGDSLQLLMQDPKNWDPQHGPGDNYFSYTNLNFPIVGSIVERVTGERFDIWMRRNVLEPMRLDACYNWPTCSDAMIARAVELDSPDGKPQKDDLHGVRPACPVFVKEEAPCDLSLWRLGENGSLFAPQGGLRISARGLARVGRMLLNDGTLDGVRILSPQSVDTLVTQVWRYDGANGEHREGLLLQLRPRHAADPDSRSRLRRRHGHWRRHARRPRRRCLWHEERHLDRPATRAAGSPISSPECPTMPGATTAAPSPPPKRAPSAARMLCCLARGDRTMRLNYAIKFVADMDQAVAFYRDTLGLELKFASPFWSEFATGETTLALHPASAENPAGGVQLGFTVDSLREFYDRREELGLSFTQEPTEMHGVHIARFRDVDGAEVSVSGPV